jgi:hypothetical protein
MIVAMMCLSLVNMDLNVFFFISKRPYATIVSFLYPCCESCRLCVIVQTQATNLALASINFSYEFLSLCT